MNKYTTKPKNPPLYLIARDLLVYVNLWFCRCTIALTAFAAMWAANAFYAFFLLPYNIYNSACHYNHYKTKCYIITHKNLLLSYDTAAFFSASFFSFLFVFITSATIIPAIAITAIRPGINAFPNVPLEINVPI